MRRFPLLLALAFIASSLTVGPASATSACLFDGVTGVATVTVAGGVASISAPSGVITVDGAACDTATTTTTETIVVNTTASGDDVTLDLSTGPLTPGKTNELDGSSEIEVQIGGEPFSLVVVGRALADQIGLAVDGSDPTLGKLNLNDAEVAWDADVTYAMIDLLEVSLQLGDGADAYGAATLAGGGADPVTDRPVTVSGMVGPDTFVAHVGGTFDGGGGVDTLGLDWMGEGCSATITNGSVGGVDSTISGCLADANGSFAITNVDAIHGTSGGDTFIGASWTEELLGLGGNDRFVPWFGNDTSIGGQGLDELIAESTNGRRFVFDLSAGALTGQGTDSFAGMEVLTSTSTGIDTFIGNPPRSLRSVRGGGGVNVLNVSLADRGMQIRTQPGLGLTAIEAGWLLAQGTVVIGSPFGDRMVGSPGTFTNGHDEFRGMGGADRLEGFGGPDTLVGGAGNDRLIGGGGVDTCSGGSGTNVVRGCEL